MADPLPPILLPEGHEPPHPPPDRSVWLWRGAVLLLMIVAALAIVLLDRSPSENSTTPAMVGPPPSPVRTP